MTVAYAIEPFDQIVPDAKPMLLANYAEMATYQDIPLDPNWDFYQKANAIGMVRFYSVRDDGELIGYAVYVVVPRHSQYDHPWATSNLIWIRPDRRRGRVGDGLIDFIERDLTGYVMQTATSVDHPELAHLLKSRGHDPVEIVHSKRL
jgi:hypothetical protein